MPYGFPAVPSERKYDWGMMMFRGQPYLLRQWPWIHNDTGQEINDIGHLLGYLWHLVALPFRPTQGTNLDPEFQIETPPFFTAGKQHQL